MEYILKHAKKLIGSTRKRSTAPQKKAVSKSGHYDTSEEALKNMPISRSLAENMEKIRDIVGKNVDLVTRSIALGRSGTRPAAIAYLDNLIDSHHVDGNIVRPLVLDAYTSGLHTGAEIVEQIQAGNLLHAWGYLLLSPFSFSDGDRCCHGSAASWGLLDNKPECAFCHTSKSSNVFAGSLILTPEQLRFSKGFKDELLSSNPTATYASSLDTETRSIAGFKSVLYQAHRHP